jgi:hypothetical protein
MPSACRSLWSAGGWGGRHDARRADLEQECRYGTMTVDEVRQHDGRKPLGGEAGRQPVRIPSGAGRDSAGQDGARQDSCSSARALKNRQPFDPDWASRRAP